MKLIIAGGRDLSFQYLDVMHGFLCAFNLEPLVVVSGACMRPPDEVELTHETIRNGTAKWAQGIDGEGEKWALAHDIPVHRKPANFNSLGRSAGPIRNKDMAKYADALLLIWDGESRGSASMKLEMKKLNKPIYEIILKN